MSVTTDTRLGSVLPDITRGHYPWGEPYSHNLGPYSHLIGMPDVRYVYEFHHIYEHPIADRPTLPTFEYRKFRLNLSVEELEENCISSDVYSPEVKTAFEQLLIAIDRVSSNEGENFNFRFTADAIGDSIYVLHGQAISMGIPMERVMRAIHLSNLSKLGLDGRPIKRPDGKILKGPNFKEPDLSFLPERIG